MWQPIETAPRDGSVFLACKGSIIITCKMGKRTYRTAHKEWVEDVPLMVPGNLSWNPTH